MELLLRWYDNGIYYPNIFLLAIGAVAVGICVAIALLIVRFFPVAAQKIIPYIKKPQHLLQNYRRRQTVIDRMRSAHRLGSLWLMNNQLWVLVILLLVTILTRFSVSYSGKIVAAPEKIFQLDPIGRDLYTGVYEPALALVGGNVFYRSYASVGSGVLLIAGPVIHRYLFHGGYCSYTYLGCQYLFYKYFLIVSIGAYVLFLLLIARRMKSNAKIFVFLYFLIFLLGIPGSMGIERGNIDILLSVTVGFMLLFLVQQAKKRFPVSMHLTLSILFGVLGGFLVNAKLFLLPFTLILIIGSPLRLVTGLSSAVMFWGLTSYLPSALYGIKTTVSDLFWVNLYGAKDGEVLFFEPDRLAYTHSIKAIASLFTDCASGRSCTGNPWNTTVIVGISVVLLFAVLVLPFLPVIGRVFRNIRKLSFKQKLYIRFILLGFVGVAAMINLMPQITYAYRLFYSLPILLILYRETSEGSKERYYCFLSMIFLAMKGLWIFYTINPVNFTLFEARAMNIFVLLHYYYLIKSSVVFAFRRN